MIKDKDIQTYRLPEAARWYPKPIVPMLPTFDYQSFSVIRDGSQSSRFLQPDALLLPSGRLALYYALQLMGITEGDEILVPAYHCGSMLEPVIWQGANPCFYPLTESLRVTPTQLETVITRSTKALLVPHFFGFPQDLSLIRDFCDCHGIYLIEDCAHAFWGQFGPVQAGATGDFSIASTIKFFPGIEGGALACNIDKFSLAGLLTAKPRLRKQLQALITPIQIGLARYRNKQHLRATSLAPLDSLTDLQTATTHMHTLSKTSLLWFNPDEIGDQPCNATRFFIEHSNPQRIAEQRVRHYQHYQKRLNAIKGVRLLHNTLPDGVVPYALPLLLDKPSRDFPILKQLGVPMWRWEELVRTDCNISADYRLRLLQLPCHHALKDDEIDWIIDTLIKVVS